MEKLETLHDRFEKHNEEYLYFDRVIDKKHSRPDICAFLILDEICNGETDIISGATYDEIWLSIDVEELSNKITDDQIINLVRCGVRVDEYNNSLAMFV